MKDRKIVDLNQGSENQPLHLVKKKLRSKKRKRKRKRKKSKASYLLSRVPVERRLKETQPRSLSR